MQEDKALLDHLERHDTRTKGKHTNHTAEGHSNQQDDGEGAMDVRGTEEAGGSVDVALQAIASGARLPTVTQALQLAVSYRLGKKQTLARTVQRLQEEKES